MDNEESKDDRDYAHMLRRQCIINLFLQSKSARIYGLLQTCITIPNIVIGGVMSITIFSTTSPLWRVATGGLAIASTILTSLSKQLGAGERAQLHCAMVRQYNSLIQELNTYIHASSSRGDHQMDRIRQQMNKLFEMQPEPSYFAINTYEKRYKRNIEEALFDELETVAMQNAAYVELRLSRTKPSKLSETH